LAWERAFRGAVLHNFVYHRVARVSTIYLLNYYFVFGFGAARRGGVTYYYLKKKKKKKKKGKVPFPGPPKDPFKNEKKKKKKKKKRGKVVINGDL